MQSILNTSRPAGVLFLALAFASSGCDDDQSEFGPSTGVISVELDWSAATGPDAFATQFENDMGYEIELSRLMINTYSVELIPCDEDLFRRLQQPRQRPQQSSGGLIGTAWAGHGDPTRPTRTGVIRPEWPLSQDNPVFMDTLDPPDYAYCRAHYLIGRVPNDDATQGTYPDLVGLSLVVEGSVAAPGETGSEPFSIQTSAAHGTLAEFKVQSLEDGIRITAGDRIVVKRRLDALFDGVDFSTMSEQELARTVLRNVVQSVTLDVHSSVSGSGVPDA